MSEPGAKISQLEISLLQNGAVNLFHNPVVLAEAQQGLIALQYEIAVVSCLNGMEVYRQEFSRVLRWEEQFGYTPWSGSLDALNDGFWGLPVGPTGRTALVLDGFHVIAAADDRASRGVLDIIERAAWKRLVVGRILVALIQTDNPDYYCNNIGCRSANWNPTEWSPEHRGRGKFSRSAGKA